MLFAGHGMAHGVSDGFVDTLAAGGLGGLVAAAAVAFTLSRPMENVWRRATVAMVAVGGATLLAALTTLADTLGHRTGLLALAALCIGVIAAAYRAALAP